ncbi:MAG: MBL fold metallo-hydrolase [Anaerolineales bacterium]|nr:MBL fold metallo-hydrolase [Anaerolineales bacterium]
MPYTITTINLWETSLLLKASKGVNCYLVEIENGYILIDTGLRSGRGELVQALEGAGCNPGDLQLIVITHADMDHTGNCAFLRRYYDTQVAIHPAESEAVQSGNMALNRRTNPGIVGGLVLSVFSMMNVGDRFEPDITVEEGYDFSAFGFDAKVIELPGHSLGSIGLLTAEGDLFCGDLLGNIDQPGPSELVDDPVAMQASIDKVNALDVKIVYPGHGEPFMIEEL